MQAKLTPFAKLLITLAISAALFFGGRYVMDNTSWGQSLKQKNNETSSSTTEPSTASSTLPNANNSSSSTPQQEDMASAESSAFSYVAPEPVNGKLKGVVEVGASGFNSFIVRIDADKNWKLEKAEFGNSLVMENMATDEDIRSGLKQYISKMLDFGVGGKNIHFVVSSGAMKAEVTQKIIKNLKSLGYFVNTVTPQQEGSLGLKCVLPADFEEEAFVVDMGSGNTKISWKSGSSISSVETYGAKYYENGVDDGQVYSEIKAKCSQIPSMKRKTCFIIGGVPFSMAKKVRNGKERYTVLNAPNDYKLDDAKGKAGVNIYKAIKDATGTDQFVFDWDANFTIGFLLSLP